MKTLPIDARLDEIIATAAGRRRLVLTAPPGSGKTTRVAPRLATSQVANGAVLMLQPRRVAARASAQRIADENGWALGEEVGYQVRGERKISRRSIVRVATEGILTRQLLDDPFLEGIGAVILDEFHERSIHTDLAIALLREVADSVRDDLIVIVMSATLDAGPVSKFLGGCPIVRVEGRSFPVEIAYNAGGNKNTLPDRVGSAVARVIETAGRDDRGDILVFLPGVEEIRRSGRILAPLADRHDLLVLPLHGSLPSAEQDRALRSADRRKVVLATNVAETSLTIDGVTTVIDSGLARLATHDPARGLDRLELGWISRASADQRAGRAGRTAPGRCLRLWPEREDRSREAFDEPEIRRVDLTSTVLTLKSWGTADVAAFDWFEPPPDNAISASLKLLESLGALDREEKITPLGHELLAIPAHPRLARLLQAAAGRGRLEDGAAIAAILSEKDLISPSDRDKPRPSHAETSRGASDLLQRLDILERSCRERFAPRLRDAGIDPSAARRVDEVRNELIRLGRRLFPDHPREDGDEILLALVLLAYPDRVCRRRGEGLDTARMVGGRGVRLDASSVVREAEFFVAIDPRDAKGSNVREARVRIANEINPAWLSELFPDVMRRERVVSFDEARGRAVAVDTTYYRDLPIRENASGSVEPAEASEAIAAWIAGNPHEFLAHDPAASSWLERLAFLRSSMPDADLPTIDDAFLIEAMSAACAGKTTLEAVRRVPLVPLLRGSLTFQQARLLDDEAPEAIAVPTGNRIRLVYDGEKPPVLAVRLQEMFGLAETPRLAGGRVPVLLHLLGPNHRPVQITDDLKSFWNSTYFQVRKDLRNKYPKHSWPEDPWNAPPVARGRPRA